MVDEVALVGWKEIARILNVNESTMQRRKEDLLRENVIFYLKIGRPPQRRVCAFPSSLRKWATKKRDPM